MEPDNVATVRDLFAATCPESEIDKYYPSDWKAQYKILVMYGQAVGDVANAGDDEYLLRGVTEKESSIKVLRAHARYLYADDMVFVRNQRAVK